MAFTIIFYIFFIGTAIGSFLNVLIDRLPKDKSIMGRSHCDFCRRKLSAIDLIPVFSFLFLKGKCRKCKKKLSWQYPGIELLTGIVFVLVYVILAPNVIVQNQILDASRSGGTYQNDVFSLLFTLSIASCLIVIFFTDVKYQIIPDQMQIAMFVFSFLLQIVIIKNSYLVALLLVVGSGIVVMIPILLIYLLTKGRGMGFGDVKIAFNMGILLGIKSGLLALYFGFIFGAVYSIVLIILKKKKMKSKVAFGPFLILGILIIVVFKEVIYGWTMRMYGI
ncbi:hypothetical protein COY87_05795 [Candidatus Roizmanbacteria bacterium CG_4_10_14_0_8_um_filter_33_9]|uniref:Prepilin peptidase n=1 Tax=Candidatus Roizmanbacteria bacterium CG_4_10_14_0_8_um_filter_33_9 TaxID=1974826 RepID=A0A2M7QGQ6_9BACT|nr:MAG: hypothetical protein COY87_05795 [Candidatus Roizmanbacteria bacterium CG_4_10_14_0_8_um_filter_33_9]